METGINDIIQHNGIVQKTGNGSVQVRITSVSACSGCHAEGSCSMAGKEEKIVNVSGYYNVAEGDSVIILMKKSMGYRAVVLGYVLPFLAVITILIILNSTGLHELKAGLLSMAALIPYYSLLFFFRKRVDKEFTFILKN